MEDLTQQSTQDHYLRPGSVAELNEDKATVCTLIGVSGISANWELKLNPNKRWLFGRSEPPQIDFGFALSNKRLSKVHFEIFVNEEAHDQMLMIRDLSTNGTWVNSIRLAKNNLYMLVHGDAIMVGHPVPQDEIKLLVSLPLNARQMRPTEGVWSRYQQGRLLGQGAFAQVRLAVDVSTGDERAMKIVDKRKIAGVSVKREMEVLKSLHHDNIVCLHEFFEDSQNYYLVMDYVPCGDLMDYVTENGAIPEPACREIIRQVLLAVQHCHHINISHRDLKPDNILIMQDSPVVVKIADFGLAKLSTQGTFLKTFCGTLSYLAPEVLRSRSSLGSTQPQGQNEKPVILPGYSNLVDIWSVGCVAYVILTGYMPFNGSTQEELYKSIISGSFLMQPLKNVGLSAEGIDFLQRVLEIDPTKRFTAIECLNHPWISEIVLAHDAIPNASAPIPPDQSQSSRDLERQRATNGQSLKGMSSLNIQSSKVELSISDIFGSRDPSPSTSSASAESPSSGHPYSGVRDADDENLANPLEGFTDSDTWLRLLTHPDSVPHKDIYISGDRLVIGRLPGGDVDLVVNDRRISKLHCKIERKRTNGIYTVWLSDYSTNGCYVGECKVRNAQIQLFDGDVLWLFAGLEVKSAFLGFDVQFLSNDGYDWGPKTHEAEVIPLDQNAMPRAPPTAPRTTVKPEKKRRLRSLSVSNLKKQH